MKRPLAVTGFTMLCTLAVFCNVQNTKAIDAVILTAFVAFLLSLVIKRTRRAKTLPVIFLFVIISLLILNSCNSRYLNLANAYGEKEITVSGYLNSAPYRQNGKNYYIVKTDEINGAKQSVKIRVVSSSPLDFSATDKMEARVKVFLLGADSETYLNYYKSRSLTLGAYPTGDVTVEKGENRSIGQLILLLRMKMSNKIMHILPNDYGAVITGLLLGDRSYLSERTENAFRFCGVSHLFAVSGLHVSVWSLLIFDFLRKLKLNYKKSSVFSSLFCLFFMALTGFNPPVVRAGFMLIMMFSANLFHREAEPFNSIGFALTVLLCANPYNALSVSLLLSVLATLGILILYPRLFAAVSVRADKIKSVKLKSALTGVLSIILISISVTVFTLPIYIFTFKAVSTLQIISNILMVSAGTLCMETAGAATVLCLAGFGAVGEPLLLFSALLSKILTKAAYFLSSFRYALFPLEKDISLILIIIFSVTGLVFYLVKYRNGKVIKALCIIFAVVFAGANIFCFFADFNKVKLSVPDVGNGCAVVMSFKGKSYIFTYKGEYFAESAICDIMNTYAISTVDYLFLPESAGSCERILGGYPVNRIYACNPEKLEAVSDFSGLNKIDKSVICEDGLVIGIDRNFAQIEYGRTKVLISFSDSNSFKGFDCDLLICNGKIPDGVCFKSAVSSCGKGKSAQGHESDIYYVCESGEVFFTFDGDKNLRREN